MPKIVIITGVSTAGKSTLLGNVSKKYSCFHFPESFTTREFSERDMGSRKKYNHVTNLEFLEKVSEDYFLEWEKVHSCYYGTPKRCLRQAYNEKKDIALDIDPKGAIKLLSQKTFDYDFVSKGFFVWRDIYPLADFNNQDLERSIEEKIRIREKDISEIKLRNRINSALLEYDLAKKNSSLFTFIENKNGDESFALNQFSEKYNPTFYPH